MRLPRLGRILSLLVAVVLTATVFWWFDPLSTPWSPRCVLKELTGWNCPGCGIQRALHAAVHGEWSEALSYNFFLLLVFPYLCGLGVLHWWRPGGRWRNWLQRLESNAALRTYLVLFFLWWIVRNLWGI